MRTTSCFLMLAALLGPIAPSAASARQVDAMRHHQILAELALRRHLEAARFSLEHAQLGLSADHASLGRMAASLHAARPSLAKHARFTELAHRGVLEREMAALRHSLGSTAHVWPAARVPESFAPQDPADSLYREARSLFNRAQYRDAARLFRRLRTEQRYSRSAYQPGSYYWEAYALTQSGRSTELRQARELLAQMRSAFPQDRQISDAEALDATIAGRLARNGDAEAAADLQRRASGVTARSASAAQGQCPDEKDDVRLLALNALLQMNSDNVVPMLRELMARRDQCSAPLRRQAIFLLSQRRSDGVDEILLDAVRSDPDPEVQEAAVFWLSQVNTPAAVAALEQILRSSTNREMQEKALFALAQNRSARATEILRSFVTRTDIPAELHRHAIYQLGMRHGTNNSQFLRELYPQLQDADLRQHIVYAVAQSRDPGSAEWLLEIAQRENESTEVRRQALFFGVQHGAVPMGRVAQLYDRAPDREFKEAVLFALSQKLNDSAAVDKLMDIARNEKDPELNRNAIFWLSQSRDPRVTQLLLEIIKR